MEYKIVRDEDYLAHHGIKGQKWGVRNGPPYPLGSRKHSKSEQAAGWRSSLKKNGEDISKKRSKSEKENSSFKKESSTIYDKNSGRASGNNSSIRKKTNTKKDLDLDSDNNTKLNTMSESKWRSFLKNNLGLSDRDVDILNTELKILGIYAGTTAAIIAAAYLYSYLQTPIDSIPNDIGFDYLNVVRSAKSDIFDRVTNDVLESGYNLDGSRHAIPLGKNLFNNALNGDYIGELARNNGYDSITKDVIESAIREAGQHSEAIDYNDLIERVRLNQVGGNSYRRLSCWSTANGYWFSALTGGDFVSKDFENLADFNDFGRLYSEQPKIFDILGNGASDFVGKFGNKLERADETATKNLINSILSNISSSNNVSADGTRTVGFINAAYHSTTCTHEFNFELIHDTGRQDLSKILVISDGYSGERYTVAAIDKLGNKVYAENGLAKFVGEMRHYNAESVRFYAPSIDSIDPEMLSNVILGKK